MELRLNKETEIVRIEDLVTGSNCYVILGMETCVIIDPNNFLEIHRVLQKRNISPSIVLLTHGHCDHISGLNELRATYDVIVVSTAACSEEIQNSRKNMSRMMEMFLYYKSGETQMVSYKPFVCEPSDVTFYDEVQILFEEKWLIMKALPGHTGGSGVVIFDDQIFSGDYLIPNEKVVTRLPGGDEADYEQYTKPWLRGIPNATKIFPGHGMPFEMSGEVRVSHEL